MPISQSVHLAADPGSGFNYDNQNYVVAARLVEVVSGQPFADYLHDHLFTPLGMTDSFAVNRLDDADSRIPSGHVFAFGRPIAISNPAFFLGGAGGIVSSAADMAKWLEFQQLGIASVVDKPVLSRANLELMHRASAPRVPYGFGWFVESATHISHQGITPTFTAYESVSLDGGFSFAVLSNGSRTFVNGSSAAYARFAVRDLARGDQPTSFGVSTRGLDIVLLILSALICVAAVRSVKSDRTRRSRVRNRLAILTWLVLLIAIVAIPKLLFESIGGRAQAWSIGFESSAWIWLFYVSPMGALLCASVALCAVTVLIDRIVLSAKRRDPGVVT